MPIIPMSSTGGPGSSARSAGRGLGCALVGCCALLLLVASGVGVAAWLLRAPAPLGPPPAEVIEYDPVKDSPTGPSRVKPSGRSARTLKTPGGVVRLDAAEITLAADVSYPSRPKVCRGNAHLTDLVKGLAFDIDREMRASTPLSIKEERRLGDQLAEEIAGHPRFRGKIDTRDTRKWRAYLARVAQPILAELKRPDFEYRFHVIDLPEANAFAIPGGHIYFFTGMLDNIGGTWLANEAQLAAILAHEISHVDLGHCAAVFQYLKRLGVIDDDKKLPAALVLTLARGPFSSNQEDEADINATDLMALAQYAPSEFVNLWIAWDALQPATPDGDDLLTRELDNLLRSHSPPRARACNVLRRTQEIIQQTPFDRFTVGQTNFDQRTPRTRKQF